VLANVLSSAGAREARARITVRIRRLSLGNPGDVKPVGGGVSEMRIDYGPGYQVYFVRHGDTIVVLLCGGDKRNQDRDIARAAPFHAGRASTNSAIGLDPARDQAADQCGPSFSSGYPATCKRRPARFCR
jgi:putative addiction module killer protein